MTPAALFLLLAWQSPPATVDEVLARIQTNTGEFEQSLPDFVCDEKVTSKGVHKGKLTERTVESHFVGLQKKNGNKSFTETREIVTIDGKPARRGQKMDAPFLFGGGFSSVLNLTFAAKNTESQTYKITGEEILEGRPALVIEFATKEGQKDLFFDNGSRVVAENDTGKAWFDKESLRILRLERHYLNVPKGSTPVIAEVEYGEVRIGDKPFWMPLTVRAEAAAFQIGSSHAENGLYLAVYSNYRKFDVSTGIVFEDK
jgi:hypothetical protein